MLIGDPATFAVECYLEPLPNETRRVFGRMCTWAGGHPLGDINEPVCMLNVTEGCLERFLQRIDSLDDPVVRELSDRDAFEFLDRALYGNGDRSDAQIAIDARRFSKFDFLTNGGESFDRTKSFVTEAEDGLRLLFEDDKKGFAFARVPRDAFVSVIRSFLAWVAKDGENAG